MTAVAWLSLAALIGWLVGLQVVRAGHAAPVPLPRAARRTSAALAAVAALLVVPRFHEEQPHAEQPIDVTAVVLVLLTGWLVVLQSRRVGRVGGRGLTHAERVTTLLLGAAAVVLAAPRLYLMVT